MAGHRSRLRGARWWSSWALAASLAVALGTPLAAQQTGGGGIETQQLEPLRPSAEPDAGDGAPRDERFKRAPFRTPEIPMTPELIAPVATALRGGARLRLLDKMTGRTQTFVIPSGAEEMMDRLRIRLETCRSPEANALHGTMALLQIWDTKRQTTEPVFSGWMFAESPALSALDHPRYDVWVISCTTDSGEAPKASE